MVFPTVDHRLVDESREANEIKSNMQNGKVIARKAFSKTRKSFDVTLELLTSLEARSVLDHYDSVETILSFSWVNPVDNEVYQVRYAEPITLSKNGVQAGYERVNPFKLVEV